MIKNDNGSDRYAQYFDFRKVAPESYRDFRLPAYLKKVLPANRRCAILDIGCGFGQMLRALREEGYQSLEGIDIAQRAVQACRADGHEVTQVESIPGFCREGGRRYDFIIMSHVLEHIEKSEVVATLHAIRTHLMKDGGALVVMTLLLGLRGFHPHHDFHRRQPLFRPQVCRVRAGEIYRPDGVRGLFHFGTDTETGSRLLVPHQDRLLEPGNR